MAFSASQTVDTVFGNKRVTLGTYTQASGDTGGDVTTGLSVVEYFDATGATKISDTSGTVTIVTADTAADQTGFWLAIGY